MNPPRATDRDYIDFLIGTPRVASATEAARVQPPDPKAPAHDAFTRLLTRLEPDPETLWLEVRPLVRRSDSILVIDDTVLDKPYAHKMGLVGQFWSGKHQRVLRGINLVTLAWSDGEPNSSIAFLRRVSASTSSPSPGATATPSTPPTTASSIPPRFPSATRTSTSARCSPRPRLAA
jgi:hypothetical protein